MTIRHINKFCGLTAGVCIPLGAAAMFLLPSIDFLGLILFGLGCLALCYRLLFALEKYNRPLARILCIILSLLCGLGLIAAFFTGIAVWKACQGDTDKPFDYLLVLGCGVNGTVPSR